jgi:hypothetical protein
MKRTLAIALALVASLAAGCGSSNKSSQSTSQTTTTTSTGPGSATALAPIHGKYAPSIDPANFLATIDNPYFPLKPGTGFHFRGIRGTTPQTDDAVVTHRTVKILGIVCTAVRDVVSEHGRPIERTLDYYAQDKDGNVWYMGEDSYELQNGHFAKASDSWRSGVDGAMPGIIMPAHPQPGDSYRQEYYPQGEAMDEARVIGIRGPVTVPYSTFQKALTTSEFSPLEPQTEEKYYVAGIGEVREKVVKGHREEFRLVRISHQAS